MEPRWLIIGISGVTCSGKTTLANECLELLSNVHMISQDNYFLPEDSDKHIYIPELKHFNWEVLTSLDMEKMFADVKNFVKYQNVEVDVSKLFAEFQKWDRTCEKLSGITKEDLNFIKSKQEEHNINILLLEGFTIFNYPPIEKLCHLKFYLTLTRETCYTRRSTRDYNPPDVPGYFDKCVWPEHEKMLKEVEQTVKNVVYLPETDTNKSDSIFTYVLFYFKTLK